MNKIRTIVHNWKAYWGELKNKRNEEGLTLIELMVVVVILGIIAAIAIPAISSAINSAKQNTTISDLSTIQQALERYYLNNNQYPSTLQSLINSSSSGTAYLATSNSSASGTELDGWGNAIGYGLVGTNNNQGYYLISGDGQSLKNLQISASGTISIPSNFIYAAGGISGTTTNIGQTPVLIQSSSANPSSIQSNLSTVDFTAK